MRFLFALLLSLVASAAMAEKFPYWHPTIDQSPDVRVAAEHLFKATIAGDDRYSRYARWYRRDEDSPGADVESFKKRAYCSCVGDAKGYATIFEDELSLALINRFKVLSTKPLPVPRKGVMMADMKVTRMAEVEVEFERVGETIGRGQYEWTLNLYPPKTERKTFKFVYLPNPKEREIGMPDPGWHVLYTLGDPMYISPQALAAYYEKQASNARKWMEKDKGYEDALALAQKNLEALQAYRHVDRADQVTLP